MTSGEDDPLRIGRLRSGATGAVDRAGRAEGAQATTPVEGTAASAEVTEARATDAIAEALSAGAIDAEQVKAELIAQAVHAQLGPGADPEFVADVTAEIEALLAGDPTLDALLR